ncbi:DUF1289 domain-containing protein [Alteromonas sediminis]|uniref:DUF1289 domain-containing protein n=1 Tax=Alteromonas sediminis TaxID=2259342 RepID=A0A3N5YF86_9ALTE|nr:DUF1289 domain-containing protein [Alteromonas sediminis]RPJ68645.1 DUF1289 domain-containing protein [Alteromonas sediminis]
MESPCIRLCTLDDQDVCVGCNRSIDEIVSWHHASQIEKQAILSRAKIRESNRPPVLFSDAS